MKTILTLITFISISSVALAGEKHPSVTVTSTGEFKIVIDGKQFNNEKKVSLNDLQKGHTISMFGKRRKDYSVVNTSLFHQSSLNWQIKILISMLISRVISLSVSKEKDGMAISGITRIRTKKMIRKTNKIIKQCTGK
jgi:hypothetical protein